MLTLCRRALGLGLFLMMYVSGVAQAWEISSPHPAASQHPTATGRMLVELHQQGQRVWTGYGDYGAKWTTIPPINLYYYLPSQKRWVWARTSGGENQRDPYRGPRTLDGRDARQFAFESDAVYRFRSIDRSIWAPAADPRSDLADFAVFDRSWRQSRQIRQTANPGPVPAHIFDVVSYNNVTYAIGSAGAWGSTPSSCTIWRSTDDGGSWSVAKQFYPSSGYTHSRCYFGESYRGRLWVQPYSYRVSGGVGYAQIANNAWHFDGTVWRRGQSIFPDGGATGNSLMVNRIGQGGSAGQFVNPPLSPATGDAVPAADRRVLIATQRSPGSPFHNGYLVGFNGRDRGVRLSGTDQWNGLVWDYSIHDGYLYVLMANGEIMRTNYLPVSTDEPVVWSRKFATHRAARSISVSGYQGNVRITVGRKDARVAWRDFDCSNIAHPLPCRRVR